MLRLLSQPVSSRVILLLSCLCICNAFLSVLAFNDPARSPGSVPREQRRDFMLHSTTKSVAEIDGVYNNSSNENDTLSLVLAQTRTTRKDPSHEFEYYTGGWNISNSHYWASVGFTAVPLFLISAIWLLLFGLSLCIICLRRCCCCCPSRRKPYRYSRIAYVLSLVFLLLFTITTGVGCFVLFDGQKLFHNKTTDTLDYVVSQANATFDTIANISVCLSSAKNVSVDSLFLPTQVQAKIDEMAAKVDTAASTLSTITQNNAVTILNVLDKVRTALVVIATIMLFLAFLGFLLSVFGFQCIVYFLIIFGWILVAGTFLLSGVFLLLHNVVADTCVAMEEWVENPTAHTALDDILPCLDNATAQEALVSTRDVTFQLVTVVDGVIQNESNINYPPEAEPLYFNQSGPLMPLLCNPYNSDSTDRTCAAGEVSLDNASLVWQDYVCQISQNGICTTPGRLTPNLYADMVAAANVSYGLYRYAPFLVGLVDCTFVRETFADISQNYCPGLRRYSQWVYVGLVMVSCAVMLSVIFWVIYARERRHRAYTKQFMTH
uniref:Uncharacterized protein n=1 Tax=Kalanchoe fedtschenkoi TaxID=63787 RepID=A0A7N0UET2_KALFE